MRVGKIYNPLTGEGAEAYQKRIDNEKRRKEVCGILRSQGFVIKQKKGESFKKAVKPGFENQPFYVSPSGNVRIGNKDGILVRYENFILGHRN